MVISERTMGYQRGVPAFLVGNNEWDLDRLPRDFSMVDPKGFSKTRSLSNQLMFNHQFNSSLKFTTLFRAANTFQDQFDVTPDAFSTGVVDDSLNMSHGYFKQDPTYQYQSSSYVTFSTKTGSIGHALIGGIDFSSTGRTYEYAGLSTKNLPIDALEFSWASYDRSPSALANADYQTGNTDNTRLFALYLQDQITISDKWKALLGIRVERHDYNTKAFDLITNEVTFRDTLEANALTPRIGVLYQPITSLSIYGSYTQGFQPQYGSNRGGGGPFDPEKSRQYEIGIKQELLGGKIFGMLSGYYIEKYDVLASDPTDSQGLRLIQIDNVTSKGIEFSVNGELSDNFNFVVNYALNDTYTPGDSGFDFYAKGRFPNAPKHNFNAWLKYRFTKVLSGLSFGAGLNSISERETFVTGFSIPGYTTLDANISYKYKNASVNLGLYNLADVRYYYGAYGPANLWIGNPRSFRLSVGYNF